MRAAPPASSMPSFVASFWIGFLNVLVIHKTIGNAPDKIRPMVPTITMASVNGEVPPSTAGSTIK